MADEPSENKEESEAEVAARRFLSDWFGRGLGDEWMEVEPGIYRHVVIEGVQIPPAKLRGQEEQSQAVDQTLLQALSFDESLSDLLPAAPGESKRPTAAPSAPSTEVGDRPGRWRRR
jgi:hypothetical protein